MNNHGNGRVIVNWLILCIMLAGLYSIGTVYSAASRKAAEVHVFSPDVVAQEIRLNNVQELTFTQDSMNIVGRLNPEKAKDRGPAFKSEAVSLAHVDEIRKLAEEKKVKYNVVPPAPAWIGALIGNLFWLLLFFGVWWFFVMRKVKQGGEQAMKFGSTKAERHQGGLVKIKFSDVAGCEEAKEDLREVVDFLKNPHKFSRLGGKIPKGVLLFGPPGNGKTLLAKAVAGEADVPFYSSSASEFVEMFVGVGASRIRDLFDKAKKDAPCIIFVDELDAVGRHRFAGVGGGHDEREQTLNQLLVELDGFSTNEGVILIAATNRPDVLDPALLRPGRFDRQVLVPPSNIDGRLKILEIHSVGKKLGPDVNLRVVARRTPGFSGADLENVMNEAALLAVRANKENIGQAEIESAIYRIMVGPQKSKSALSEKEKKIIAYHESGHTLAAIFTEGSDPVHKVSIIPRGQSLGHTLQLPEEERSLMSKAEMLGRLKGLVGGRVAEELYLGRESVTAGASDDFNRATGLVRRMVMEFGMGSWLSVISTEGRAVNRLMTDRSLPPCSEKRQQEIDEEVEKILQAVMDEVRTLLSEKRIILDKLAAALLDKEELDGEEVNKIVNSA